MEAEQQPAADQAAGNEPVAMEAEANATEAAAPAPEPANPLLERCQELLKAVTEKPDDFNTWTSLISTAEKLDDVQQIRSAYDAFLAEFPLCYGYWKRYAEAERRHGSSEAAAAVLERGVAATPYSTELWVAYANLLLAADAETDAVRSVLERGLAYVGPDWLSSSLWDKALELEGSAGSPASVAALYARVLGCPIKELDKYHTGLVSYAASRTAHELLPEDVAAALRSTLEQQAAAKQQEAAAAAAAAAEAAAAAAAAEPSAAAGGDEAAAAVDGAAAAVEAGDAAAAAAAAAGEGDAAAAEVGQAGGDAEMTDAAAAEQPAAEQPAAADAPAAAGEAAEAAHAEAAAASAAAPAAAAASAAAAEAAAAAAKAAAEAAAAVAAAASDDAVKALWLQQQEAVYTATKQQQQARQQYEAAIRRPYWHVKPLDAAQLRNWAAYLDWQEAQGELGLTVRLYERCCVPCASYPEFWQRYVLWCEANQPEAAAAVLARATAVHCKRRPDLAVFAARFHEAAGDADAARAAYRRVLSELAPGLLEVVLAAANFERRMGQPAAAAALFEELLQQEREKGSSSSSSSVAGFLSLLYANFLRQVYGDVERARQVLQEGLAASPACQALWEGALFFEETLPGDDRVARVLALYEQALAQKKSSSSSSSSSDSKSSVQQRHNKLFMLPASALAAAPGSSKQTAAAAAAAAADAARKRGAPADPWQGYANGPMQKMPRGDEAAAAAAMGGGYHHHHHEHGGGYGFPPPPAGGYGDGGYGVHPPPYGYGHHQYPPYGYGGYGY
ncbi:hypothetical protein OEZ86_008812 [Tetradesmus obliquus]|nr:hypothetical protein OEZ86_008812 [Tetradesmus obliquus]